MVLASKNILVKQQVKQEASTLFFYLLSTMDCSHNINQFREKVSLHPIDCIYEDFRQYSKTGEYFMPMDLESRDIEKRTKADEIVRKFLRMR